MKSKVKVNFSNKDAIIKADIVLITFKDKKNIYITYCPQLEVSGYGTNEDEALQSFNYNLEQYFDYTTKKKTLIKDLIQLGWQLKNGTNRAPKKIIVPAWSLLIQNNKPLERILNNNSIVTQHKSVSIPLI